MQKMINRDRYEWFFKTFTSVGYFPKTSEDSEKLITEIEDVLKRKHRVAGKDLQKILEEKINVFSLTTYMTNQVLIFSF